MQQGPFGLEIGETQSQGAGRAGRVGNGDGDCG